MRNLRIILAALAVSLLALFGTVQPASATVHWDCSNDAVCLYQWKGFDGPSGSAGRWQSSFNNINVQGCLNLTSPMAYWPNGTKVTDNSASLVINGVPGGGWGSGWDIALYNWANCNSGGGIAGYFGMDDYLGYSDLSTVPIGGGLTAYHTITSMGLAYSCPPGGCTAAQLAALPPGTRIRD